MSIAVEWIVKVYTGVQDNLPLIGNNLGVATWSTSDQSLGILTDSFFGTIQSRVDISVGGNYSQYSDLDISIVRSSLVETTLKNYGGSLVGSMVDVIEKSGAIQNVRFRGVIDRLEAEDNTTILSCSHLTNTYSVDMTKKVGDEKGVICFGEEVQNVKLLTVVPPSREDAVIADDLIPVFFIHYQDQFLMILRSAYDESFVTKQNMIDFFATTENYLMKGEESLICKLSAGDPYTLLGISGVNFWGVTVDLVPMNLKNVDGEVFALESQVVLEPTEFTKLYFPECSNPLPENLAYESNGDYFAFPSYVDSRVDYADRIEILDADNVGYTNVLSKTVTAILYCGETGEKKNLANGVNSFTLSGVDFAVVVGQLELYGDLSSRTGTSFSITYTATSTNNFAIKFSQSYRFGSKDLPEGLFSTKYNYATWDSAPSTGTPRYFGFVSKIKTLFQDESYREFGFLAFPAGDSIVIHENLFPYTLNAVQQEDFRWINDGAGGGTGLSWDSFSGGLEDWEKSSFVGLSTELVFSPSDVGGSFNLSGFMQEINIRPCEYSTDNIYFSTVGGALDPDGDVTTGTASAYRSTLYRQNYETAGITTPAEGWGLGYPTDSLAGVIDTAMSVYDTPISYKADDSNTIEVKLDLLRYTCGIGYIDNQGREAWTSAVSSASGAMFTPYEITEKTKPQVKIIDGKRVYCEIGVNWLNGSINVTNTEKETFDASYVTGVTGAYAEELWTAGRLLYKLYKTKNVYPKTLANITGISTLEGAVEYCKNQYRISGIVFEGSVALFEMYDLRFNTSHEYLITENLQLGSPITFFYQNIAESGHKGKITDVSVGFSGECVITARMAGDVLYSDPNTYIIETGDQDDTITESGNETTNYIEGQQ